jgi:hypothetical protein
MRTTKVIHATIPVDTADTLQVVAGRMGWSFSRTVSEACREALVARGVLPAEDWAAAALSATADAAL